MRKHLLRITCLALMATMFTPVMGQDVEQQIKDLVSSNAEGYLGPFPSLFGTAMNTGVFRTAKPHKLLGFDVHLNVMFVGIPDADKTFDFTLPTGDIPLGGDVTIDGAVLYENANTEAPTFFGSEDDYEIAPNRANIENVLPFATSNQIDSLVRALTFNLSGTGLDALPMVVPQFSLGLMKDIEISFGAFGADAGDSKFSISRFGTKIGINQFIPTPPLVFPEFSVGYYITTMKLGDVLEAKSSVLSLQASKSIPILTLYGGFGIEKSTIDIKLDDDDGNNLLDFNLEGENGFRTTIGVRIKLLLLSINADYNMGKYPTTNIGLGLTFR